MTVRFLSPVSVSLATLRSALLGVDRLFPAASVSFATLRTVQLGSGSDGSCCGGWGQELGGFPSRLSSQSLGLVFTWSKLIPHLDPIVPVRNGLLRLLVRGHYRFQLG